jgi:adenylosuccinate lyase
LGLQPQLVTTQILPSENVLRVFSSLVRINGILLDCAQDCWRYISDGYFKQSVAKGQVGSSTMPQKINPIDFENAEGNLGIANALLIHFLQKLPVSRLQRDLSDSTVKRNFGSALGYCSLAYQSLTKGLEKVSLDRALVERELDDHWEVLAEAYQIVLRQHGISNGYELLKDVLQGETFTEQQAREWVEQLSVSSKVKKALSEIMPKSYMGIAPEITQIVVHRSEQYLKGQYEHS